MDRPVNVYGLTEYYEDGLLECLHDGFGYKDNNGDIIWYEGYEPKWDEFHWTTVIPYGNEKDLDEMQ